MLMCRASAGINGGRHQVAWAEAVARGLTVEKQDRFLAQATPCQRRGSGACAGAGLPAAVVCRAGCSALLGAGLTTPPLRCPTMRRCGGRAARVLCCPTSTPRCCFPHWR